MKCKLSSFRKYAFFKKLQQDGNGLPRNRCAAAELDNWIFTVGYWILTITIIIILEFRITVSGSRFTRIKQVLREGKIHETKHMC
jgi:hypothetical protein